MTVRASAALQAVTIALAIAAAVGLASTLVLAPGGPVTIWVVAVLLGLTVASSQRVAIFGDETAINTSMVVLLASAGLAAAGGPLWVPAACGIVAGLHWDHVRNFAVRRLVVNASCTTLAVISASLAGRVLQSSAGTLGLLVPIVGLGAACVYWLVDNGLVALVLSAVDGSSPTHHLKDLTRSETQILPFALVGFLLAFVVPSRFGDLIFAVSLVGLVVLADAVVVQSRGWRSIRRLFSAAFLPTTLLCVISVLALAAVEEGIPKQAAFPWLLGAGIFGSLVVTWRMPTLAMFAPIACASGVGIALGANHALFAAMAIATSACLVPVIRLSSWLARLTLLCAAGVSSIAISWSLGLVPQEFAHSFWGASLAGLVAGLAGLVGWHFVFFLTLARRLGNPGWRIAFGNAASDVAISVFAGLIGGLSAWVLLHSGLAASGAPLIIGFALAVVATRPTTLLTSEPRLADNQLVDVLQSALLDLPASRVRQE
jgi:hypothetical protein